MTFFHRAAGTQPIRDEEAGRASFQMGLPLLFRKGHPQGVMGAREGLSEVTTQQGAAGLVGRSAGGSGYGDPP